VSTKNQPPVRLAAVTTPLNSFNDNAGLGSLISRLTPSDPLLFVRRGNGIAGIGEVARLEFTGEDRITEAATAWRDILAGASTTDPLGLPGTGLVAFGSFAFSEHSAATSVLIIPAVVVGRHGSVEWITQISELSANSQLGEVDSGATSPLPAREPLGAHFSVTFEPGEMPPAAFEAAVNSALTRIDSGIVSKVVLARDLIGHLPSGADLRVVLDTLATGYPDCFTFAVNGFIGSSPETLVKVDRGSVSARVLAGSVGRGADSLSDDEAAAALATSTKDLDEHGYALRSVLAALNPHSANLATSELPFTLKLPNLWHLASDVEGTLTDGSTSLDLVAALHPTAAVAGSPTPAALAVIHELEPFDRGRYAGPVGWVGSNGDGEWAVALRCAHVSSSGRITAYAGSGIVTGSVAARELAETKMKFRPIVEAFS
jgi:menaquinone-specific isochorismate synthase